MKRALTACALVAVLSLAAPRAAHACGSAGGGYGGVVAAILVVGTATAISDVGFIISDTSKATRSEVPGVGHGVAELFVSVPQVVLSGALLASSISNTNTYQNNTGAIVFSGAWLALSAGLGAHAIWTFASQGREGERAPMPGSSRPLHSDDALAAAPRPPRLGAQLMLAPTLLENGQQRAPGLAALLRF